jgi:hypothetical protein
MTIYIFKGGSEYIKLNIVTREKILIATSKTSFKWTDVSKKFYDSEKEKQKCLKLSEDAYKMYLVMSFMKQGYKFIQKQD